MRILYNANIYTLDPTNPVVSAVAIRDERIVMAGNDREVLAEARPGDQSMDLAGRTVWPGLTDAHIHLENYALSLQLVDCETQTLAECLQRVASRAASTPDEVWVRGHGWNQNVWGGRFGTAAELDEAAPRQPVFLTAKSLHAAWANTRALELAGINENTPDPPDGKIDRDDQGKPTGILFEEAMELVYRILPEPSVDEVTGAISKAQETLWRFGITGVHDYDRSRCFAALQVLHQNKLLHLHVLKSIPLEELSHAVSLGLRTGFGDDFLRLGSVKLFADGALGPHTAAMLEPYENESQTGMLFLDAEQILEHGITAARNGISMAIHAIGDRANHEVLNAYEHLRQYETENRLPHLRHRIEHVQILHPDDCDRLARDNIIASVQPVHATSDMFMADAFWGMRSAGAYAYKTLESTGAHLAFGSDAPVESPDPFLGMYAAVTRRRTDGSPGSEGWYPEQRVSLETALSAYTTGPAFAAGMEDRLGKLTPGYYADLIVLNENPFRQPPDELYHIKPQATMVAGQWMWSVL